MQVHLKRAFFIDGYRFSTRGVHDVPDRFKGRLPADAEILGEQEAKVRVVEDAADAPARNDRHPLEAAKGYRLPPKEFKGDGSGAPVAFKVALKAAVKGFVSNGPGNDIDAWNALPEAERKKHIIAASETLLQAL